MSSFRIALEEELVKSLRNSYGNEIFDKYRFGEPQIKSPSALTSLKATIKKIIGYRPSKKVLTEFLLRSISNVKKYEDGLEFLYQHLNKDGRELVTKLVAYRILGYRKVKLPRNNQDYWNALELAKTLADPNDTYDPHFMHFILQKFNLTSIGYDVKLFFSDSAIAIDYIIEQYTYKIGNEPVVFAANGDVVLDVGGCWGDTALYFASKVGPDGRVYSFEFIPDNIKLFNMNVSFNPRLAERIELVPRPVSNEFGEAIYFKDHGPGSRIEKEPFADQTGFATTITIDEFCASRSVTKVDFIKMDIEGSEPKALQGAIETIKKYKPKLAIAIYHSMEDFVNIPKWIHELGLGYELFLGHYTIHAEETICFAKQKEK